MKKFKSFFAERCWPGYKPASGKKAYSKGSCVKEEAVSEDLRKWFKEKWVRMDTQGNIKGECAKEEGEGKPKCLPLAKARSMDKKDRATAVRRKRREDPNPDRQGAPINVNTEEYNNNCDVIQEVSTSDLIKKSHSKRGAPGTLKAKVKGTLTLAKVRSLKNRANATTLDKKQANFYINMQSEQYLEEKNVPTQPEKWARAKSAAKQKFDVYPSAYANGWAAKKYKAMGGSWKSVAEASSPAQQAAIAIAIKNKRSLKQLKEMLGKKKKNGKQVPNCVPEETELEEGLRHKLAAIGVAASLAAGAAHGQDTRRITPGESENRFPNAQQTDVKKDTERKKTVTPPSKEYLHKVIKGEHAMPLFTKERAKELLKKHYDEDIQEEKTPAWQRREGKNPKGGLNKAGIASYRADNPGSTLSLAVTTKPSKLKKGSKAANRRKSFCARMGGMKKRLTSAKTARDPDSRINKALRKWNC